MVSGKSVLSLLVPLQYQSSDISQKEIEDLVVLEDTKFLFL